MLAVVAAGALTASLAAAGATSFASPSGLSAPPPTTPGLRLVSPADQITAYGDEGGIYLQPSVWLASYGEGREYWATRAKVSDPVTLKQTVIRGTQRSTTIVPKSLVDGMSGFKDGLTSTVSTAKGKVLKTTTGPLCPGGYDRQRVDRTGPAQPTYPDYCGGAWFSKTVVFGIEQGWAAAPDFFTFVKTKQTELVVTYSIRKQVADFLGIPADARSVTQHVTVVNECEDGCLSASARAAVRAGRSPGASARTASAAPGDMAAATRPASSTAARAKPATSAAAPAADTVPDLASIPAWGISVTSDRPGDDGDGLAAGPRTDRLNFNANEWNAGPAPMVVEGFRRGTEPIMDAYQMFYRNGRVVASKLTGTMEFDSDPEHNHWHFQDFAKYDLVRMDGSLVTTSGKESWCLAPTDAVDLSIPTAVWRPDATGLQTTCGDESALWQRETMPVGWGDTYSQYQTTAFDLTGVPNGKYQIKITVNPNGNLYESTAANDVSLRTVILGGTPGARTVTVPRYMGVDTEGDQFPEGEGAR